MAKYFVFCEINGDDQPNVLAAWGVSGFPTTLFISKDSQKLHEVVGYRPVSAFVAEMDKVRQAAGL